MIHIQRQLGVNPDIQKYMVVSKTYTKQESPMKTRNSKRRLEMPDVVLLMVDQGQQIKEVLEKHIYENKQI